jgi:hypothetical protein
MLQGTRIPPVDVKTLPDDLREVLEEQRKLWGEPLYPYLFYARDTAYFRAAQMLERLPVLTGCQCCREQQVRHLDGEDRRVG